MNLLFKTYFKLNSASLSRTILTSLKAYDQRGDMPPLESFPKSQRVTFRYYEGVLFFLEEDYVQAEARLTEAWLLCSRNAKENLERILMYLIPCRMLTSHVLPTKKLLEPFPRLRDQFLPLAQCIRRGDLRSFDQALQKGEDIFVKRRIYLTLERGRDIALRNLLRKVFIAGGFEEQKEPGAPRVRRTRIPIAEFQAAISMGSGGQPVDSDEVECLLANMIYKVSPPSLTPLLQSHISDTDIFAGLDEGVHCARARHGGPVKEGGVPGHWRVSSAGWTMHTSHDGEYEYLPR